MRRFLSLLILALVPLASLADAPDAGVLPLGDDGKPLNLDFETGTLKDWTATGDAFKNQPVKGDTVAARRGDMKSRHQGNYWIGTYERGGDQAEGTLTSKAFTVTHPYATFLVGGGSHATTRVELVLADGNKVFHHASGVEAEDMRREAVDLRPLKGKKIFVRIVDKHAGHWGHVNFDDFRFHKKKPAIAARPQPMLPDTYKHAGLKPKQAAEAMTVPAGFSVKLFAGEPSVRQPIAFCLDDRGRLWVAEAYSYPIRRPDKEARDRILIFEDTKGTGTFDKRTVFMDGLNLISGIEVGFGGVWVGAAPYLMFIPIKPGEDRPAGKPQILLDGFGYQDTHETLNTFTWGPDGWLYGCHGVFTHSKVGKPGTPDGKRVPINAGVWRYHPTRHVFEVFAEGTSNPWGLDFNDRGQAFVSACVIPHNWHIIQNARYQRQAGPHFNPFTYDDIKTIAVHRHYVGGNPHGGNERSDSAGGGHAHCGAMIYLGDTWPAKYRDQMFMGNIHGRRFNVDRLEQKGSGYVADRAPDFLLANDAWARFINLTYGPDGNVFLIDWYDRQACHHGDPRIWDRETGRIYKVCYKDAKTVRVDLGKKSNQELIELQLHQNDWFVRHARRLLQERGLKQDDHEELDKIAFDNADPTRRLRGLWALHVTGGLTPGRIDRALRDKDAFVRGWAIQLALEAMKPTAKLLGRLADLAVADPSPVVRLYLASALQRLPLARRWAILEPLVGHEVDAGDHNLPLMYWFAAEPLAEVDAGRALRLAMGAKVPILLPFMIRRISGTGTAKSIALLVDALGKVETAGAQLAFLRGIREGLAGREQVPMPEGWPAVGKKLRQSTDGEVRSRAVGLAVIFGDKEAFGQLRKLVEEDKNALPMRRDALAALVEAKDGALPPVLLRLAASSDLRSEAIRALAAYDDIQTPKILLGLYGKLNSADRRAVVNTLSARAAYGKALLDAVAAKTVPASDISADIVRQLRLLGDKALDQRIGEVWGTVRTTPADRLALIRKYRASLQGRPGMAPDIHLGRALFNKTCVQCHVLFATGGKVGPDITGANRASLDYLLENILDPSAVIPKEYTLSVISLKRGRTISGIVREETATALTVVTATETLTVPKKSIEDRQASPLSMMPDDLLKNMNLHEVRSLIAYLQSPAQVPVLATADNAADLFNGKDLTGWTGDAKLWSVDRGEIVGKSPGIRHNEFLKSQMIATDFRLRLKVKLTPDRENSGVQFRSQEAPGGEMKGPQADIGAGWWGKLYDEQGRGLVWDKSGEKHVKPGEWNDYVIEAAGSRVRTWINGKLCVDLDDGKLSRRGKFGLQIHSGGAMEVRFKEIKLEVLPAGK